jgi:hypothetical protein
LGDPVGRIMFIRQFYNLFHMLERDEDAEDTQNEIEKLQDEIEQQDLKSLYTEDDINPKGKKRKRSGACGGAGGVRAEDCADLEARGYELKPEDIVDASGIVYEPLFKVRHPFSH